MFSTFSIGHARLPTDITFMLFDCNIVNNSYDTCIPTIGKQSGTYPHFVLFQSERNK
jgi:hypothetical protein